MTETNTYGECDWNDIPTTGNKDKSNNKKNGPSFWKWKPGINQGRFVTKTRRAAFHKASVGNMTANFKCSDPVNKTDCPFCEKGFSIRYHAYVGFLCRETGQVHPTELKPDLIKKIQKIRSDPDWSDVSSYDMTITVTPGDASNYYSPTPKMPKPLSVDDLEAIKAFDEERLNKLCLPLSREKLVENIKFVEEKLGGLVSMEPIVYQKDDQTDTKSSETKTTKPTKMTKASATNLAVEMPDFPEA